MKTKTAYLEGEEGSEIGGKAKGLLLLQKYNLRTPEFYILDFKALQTAINSTGFNSFIDNWKVEHALKKDALWAVRSSAASEDGMSKSFAGQFKSVLNVDYENLSDAVEVVIESYKINSVYSETSDSYGVIIQQMLTPDFSGVLFSKDPLKPYIDQPVISIVPGLGEKLVSGELTGLHIGFANNVPVYKDSNGVVYGERFDGKISVPVSNSVLDIQNALSPHMDEVMESVFKLEKLLDSPLDFEFVIQNGEFFWLQVRPITTRKLNSDFLVWDNTSVEANYPGTTMPLSISFVQRTFYKAYGGGGRSIGFSSRILEENKHLLKNMCGEIDGALYYNVTAWQSLLYQMPFGSKLSAKLPRLWGMDEVSFQPPKTSHTSLDKIRVSIRLLFKLMNGAKLDKRYRELHNATMDSFNKTDFSSASYDDLKTRFKTIETELGDNWLAPALNGFYTMIVFTLLKRKVEKSRIYDEYPNFVNDILFSDGDVVSVKLVRDFQKLLTAVSNDIELKKLFNNTSDTEILERLKQDFNPFYIQLFDHINTYGNRTDQGELKMETITYKQNPELFIKYLKSNLKGFVPKKQVESNFNYNEVVKRIYPLNFIQRWIYKRLIKSVIKRMKTRENYRFMRTDTFAVIRTVFLQMGEVLFADGKIDSARDVLYLELNELLDAKMHDEYRELISNRKLSYKVFEAQKRSTRYIECEDQLIPVEESEFLLDGNQLKGTGCCSGSVEGRVIVIDETTDFDQDFSNCIVISHYFEPGWINLFYQAKGVVSERGNLLSHTAIICRELNVPSIVGVKGLMKKVKSNDVITMDGASGLIKLNCDE